MSSSLPGPRLILQYTSKFTRKLAKSSSGGEAYSFIEMVGHVTRPREWLVWRTAKVFTLTWEIFRASFSQDTAVPRKW